MKNKIVRALLVGIISMSLVTSNCSYVLAANVTKEETVYVKTDKTGKETSVTVTDQLANISGKTEIKDISDLKDIKNVKGDEEYKQSGNKITWKNSGSKKIVYQGTTDKELPVGVKISYELDGKKVDPEKLSGKSGHLKINVEYENRTNGDDYVPFVMGTIFMANEDEMTNVTVDNGRTVSDGERQVIIGYGVPGIKAYLDTANLKKNDLLKDMDEKIPEGFSVEADISNYDDITCMTVALNDVFDDEKVDSKNSLNELQDSMNELTDAAAKLMDGSAELADGTQKLKDAGGELSSGVDKLDKGGSDLYAGTGTLVQGTVTLKDGAKALADGTEVLDKGAEQLYLGISQLQEGLGGVNQLAGAIEQAGSAYPAEVEVDNSDIKNSVQQYLGSTTLTDDQKNEILGLITNKKVTVNVPQQNVTLITYLKQLTGTVDVLAKSSEQLKGGANELREGIKSANAGAKDIAGGSETLWAGAARIDSGASELSAGLHTLNGGSSELVNGVNDLNNGAIELRDGMKKFNDEGISKLNKIVGKDIENLVNRVNKMTENAANYKSCTGIEDGMDGTVKFVFVTK